MWADDKCDGKESLGRLVEIYDNYDIDGVLGLPCSFGSLQHAQNTLIPDDSQRKLTDLVSPGNERKRIREKQKLTTVQ